jgi:hypothetical protein
VACGQYPHHDPRAKRANESIEQIEGYLTRPNPTRALWRTNTNGRRKRTNQVRAQELGKHQSTAPRACGGGRHQRSEDDKVLGLLGRPHRHQAQYRRKRSRMNNAPRNLHHATIVPASQSSAPSRIASASVQSGKRVGTSPQGNYKE